MSEWVSECVLFQHSFQILLFMHFIRNIYSKVSNTHAYTQTKKKKQKKSLVCVKFSFSVINNNVFFLISKTWDSKIGRPIYCIKLLKSLMITINCDNYLILSIQLLFWGFEELVPVFSYTDDLILSKNF